MRRGLFLRSRRFPRGHAPLNEALAGWPCSRVHGTSRVAVSPRPKHSLLAMPHSPRRFRSGHVSTAAVLPNWTYLIGRGTRRRSTLWFYINARLILALDSWFKQSAPHSGVRNVIRSRLRLNWLKSSPWIICALFCLLVNAVSAAGQISTWSCWRWW